LQVSNVYHSAFQIVNYNYEYTKNQLIENCVFRA